MPHVTVEYSANLRGEADIDGLLSRVNEAVLAVRADGVPAFPIGGLRTRAIGYDDYRIADGNPAHAFLHVTLRVGSGRSDATERELSETVFAAVKEVLAPVFDTRTLALSLVLERFPEVGSLKHNNIHDHLRAAKG